MVIIKLMVKIKNSPPSVLDVFGAPKSFSSIIFRNSIRAPSSDNLLALWVQIKMLGKIHLTGTYAQVIHLMWKCSIWGLTPPKLLTSRLFNFSLHFMIRPLLSDREMIKGVSILRLYFIILNCNWKLLRRLWMKCRIW